MKFDNKYFVKFNFTKEQIKKNLLNSEKDLQISQKDKILEVKFNYAYTSLLKAGIALLSFYQRKVKSIPGHHIKIIEIMSQVLEDESVNDLGNLMRSKRNFDLYGGGAEITEKECREYIKFTEAVLEKIKKIIS